MRIESGVSDKKDPKTAIAEITEKWNKDSKPDMIFVFCSMSQDANAIAGEFSKLYPDTPIAGCSTSGEHLNGKHYNNSTVATAIHTPNIRWATHCLQNLKDIDLNKTKDAVDSLIAKLGRDRGSLDPRKQFCITFIDGLSMKEEFVSAHVAEQLEGVSLLGGSSGDDLKFSFTDIICDGKAYKNAAVLVMGETKNKFKIIKHQHFKKTGRDLVITKADVANRRVYEINGIPAADAYAAALETTAEELTDEQTFLNPVTLSVNNEIYVRSIQKIEDDKSIVFYCAIEEGMVLDVSTHKDMEDSLKADLRKLKDEFNDIGFFLGFNCILRALEASKIECHGKLETIVKELTSNMIGFDTYGEQLNGMHINQTLVGIAFEDAA